MISQRGRKKGSSGEQRKLKLLTIAAEEFAENGFDQTNISTIVKKAGVTQPTFYLYFKSKIVVFEELVALFRHHLDEHTSKSRVQSGVHQEDLQETITKTLTEFFRFFIGHPHLTRIGFLIMPHAAEIKRQLALQIKENLISEIKEGYFQSDIDMEIVADGLIGMMERLTFSQLLPGNMEPEQIAEEIVRVLLYGIKKN